MGSSSPHGRRCADVGIGRIYGVRRWGRTEKRRQQGPSGRARQPGPHPRRQNGRLSEIGVGGSVVVTGASGAGYTGA